MKDLPLSKLIEEAKSYTERIKAKPLISSILERLKNELPDTLYYHNVQHTEEVLFHAILLALHDQLSEREIELLAIAASYHDAGFLKQKEDNESIAAQMADDALQQSNLSSNIIYTPEEITLIKEMIEDTRILNIQDSPTRNISNHLSRYLLDADLENLGSEKFFEKNLLIREESDLPDTDFKKMTLTLLKKHQWLSPAGEKLKEAQRVKNLESFSSQCQETEHRKENQKTEKIKSGSGYKNINKARFIIPGLFLLALGIGNMIVGQFKYEQYDEILKELEAQDQFTNDEDRPSPLQRLKSTIDTNPHSLALIQKAQARRDFYQLVRFGGRVFLSLSILYFFAYALTRYLH